MKDINLLKDDFNSTAIGKDKQQSELNSLVIKIPVILIMIAILVTPQFYKMTLNSELESIKAELNNPKYDSIKQVKKDLLVSEAQKTKTKDILNTVENKYYSFNEVYTIANSILPEGCFIDEIRSSDGKIKIAGVVDSAYKKAMILKNIYANDLIILNGNKGLEYTEDNRFTYDLNIASKGDK